MSRRLFARVAITLLGSAILAAPLAAQSTNVPPPSPRLAVVLSADQFRGDYLQRFAPYFGKGGFQRLLSGGLDFRESRYGHAPTKTAPGHATILTGVNPDLHGIVANDWFDVATGRMVNAVEDPAAPLVGLPTTPLVRSPGGVVEADAGRSPRQLLATTVGDQLKLRHGARSRVISLGGKDRSAILLGGKLADGAYWIERGALVTSRYYANELPGWLGRFNAEGRGDRAFGSTWDRLLPAAIYEGVQGPDDVPGETIGRYGLAATFPKRLDGGAPAGITSDYYEAFDCSPAATDLLVAAAIAALEGEELGHHAAPDLLCIGFSQTDLAGHLFGPDSHEVMDSVLRLDRALAELFDALERHIGLKHCVIVFTADHGAAPLPERTRALFGDRLTTGRLDWKKLDAGLNEALIQAYGTAPEGTRWARRDGNNYHLLAAGQAPRDFDRAAAAALTQRTLRASPDLVAVTTREEILAASPEGFGLLARLRRGFHPARSGDVVLTLAPYVIDRSAAGTNHGMPYDYDAHVPQLWLGDGVPAGVRLEPVGVEDIAPTLAGVLGVPRPPQALGRRLF